MQKETQVIHWVDHKEEKAQVSHNFRSYSDPTANEAIGNVMRESRKKERQLQDQQTKKQQSKGKCLKKEHPEKHYPREQEFDRTFEAGNRPELKDILAWFGNATILHIGSKTAFYFIGTARTLKNDLAFVESNMQSNSDAEGDTKPKAPSVLNRKVIKVYSKLNPSEGVVIKTEGTESGDFWFGAEYYEAKKKYLAERRKKGVSV